MVVKYLTPRPILFLDAFSFFLKKQGIPAITVNYGPIKDVGELSENEMVENRLRRFGVELIPPRLALQLTEFARNNRLQRIAAMRINFRHWVENLGIQRIPASILDLYESAPKEEADDEQLNRILSKVLVVDDETALEMLLDFVKQTAGKIVGIESSQIEDLDAFQNIGLDSLMAVEMQHKLENTLAIRLSAMEVAKDPTVLGLAKLVVKKIREKG